jgi:hypothetical protein
MFLDHKKNPQEIKNEIIQYNTLGLPVLLYGGETWTVKGRDGRRITAAEMKYTTITAGYTWTDYKTNTQICKGIKNSTNFGQITGIQLFVFVHFVVSS